jgi:positive regulator of sigma E activity
LFGNKRYRLKMPAGDGLTVGSIVYLEVPERSVTQAAALVYLVPLLLAFVGSLLGHLGDGQGEEAGAIMGALAGFFVGVVGAREMARRWSRWSEWRLVAAEDQDAVVCRWPASR